MAWSGTGTLGDPYQIYTIDDLIATTGSSDIDGHIWYKLMNDLDLSSVNPWIPLHTMFTVFIPFPADFPYFNGSFDGNNKTLSNLYFTTQSFVIETGNDNAMFGLFAILNSTGSGYIKDLNIHTSSINLQTVSSDINHQGMYSSILSPQQSYFNISNVKIENTNWIVEIDNTSNINGFSISAFGRQDGGTNIITSCSINTGLIRFYKTNNSYNSGLNIFSSYISTDSTHSYNSIKNISVEVASQYSDQSQFNESYEFTMYSNAIYGYIHDCYILNSNISSSNSASGFGLGMSSNTIHNIYTNTNFNGTPSDLILPLYEDGTNTTFENVHYISGSYTIDNIPIEPGITGSTTSNLQIEGTFTGWDFTNIWSISPSVNGGYPYLNWESYPISYDILTILTPNGGEKYRFGNTVPITWSVTQSYELVIQGFVP